MPDTIPNLWPAEIKITIQSPYAILRVQAGLLGKVTRGILEGTVETETAKDRVQHRLVVVAPAYHSYRHTLLVALHHPDLPYPAEVRAEALAKEVKRELPFPMPSILESYDTVYPSAYNDDEMVRLVEQVLKSRATMAAIQSLISKSNEVQSYPESASLPNGGGVDAGAGDTLAKQAMKTPAAEAGTSSDRSGG